VGNLRSSFLASHSARNIALYLLVSIPLGNLLVESGNLLAGWLGLKGHFFNPWFLAVGLLGMLCFGIALFRRRNHIHKTTVD